MNANCTHYCSFNGIQWWDKLFNVGFIIIKINTLFTIYSDCALFSASASMVSFEENAAAASDAPPFFAPKPENCSDDYDPCLRQPEKKRRLSHDQVQFLEKSFEVENKLEPERKIQLAKEVGLQPRQVAIWFQNRRARYKTKILEREYGSLKATYDKLKSDYDTLFQENEKMRNEVHGFLQFDWFLFQEFSLVSWFLILDSCPWIGWSAIGEASDEGEGEGRSGDPVGFEAGGSGGVEERCFRLRQPALCGFIARVWGFGFLSGWGRQ